MNAYKFGWQFETNLTVWDWFPCEAVYVGELMYLVLDGPLGDDSTWKVFKFQRALK